MHNMPLFLAVIEHQVMSKDGFRYQAFFNIMVDNGEDIGEWVAAIK